MTALSEYERLEAVGLWRPYPDAQRRDVVVSIGEATLTISDMQDRPLTHWSLAAIARTNPGEVNAVYHPDGDPDEQLELGPDEAEMIAAIERVRSAIEKRRPHPGRLRLGIRLSVVAAVAALLFFWLPDAMLRHTVKVVPAVKRAEIGAELLNRIERVAGRPCDDPSGLAALSRLSVRLLGPGQPDALVVLRDGVAETAHLPDGRILLGRALVEDPEEPDVAAGYVIAEALRAAQQDPLEQLLRHAGIVASFRLLTTGNMPQEALSDYSEKLLTSRPLNMSDDLLLAGFSAARVRATPYAYAVDVTGEITLGLIEADPFSSDAPKPVLSDAQWLQLQGICGG